MKQATYFLLLIVVLFSSCKNEPAGNETKIEKEIKNENLNIMAYYVPSSALDVNNLPFDKLTHIIYSFTEVIDHQMVFAHDQHHTSMEALTKACSNYPELKVMIACGGWGGSGGFSDMASSEENRKIFVESVVAFIKKYDLDGLDLDWEYPGLPGIGNTYRAEDKENFTSLVTELRQAMDQLKPGLLITFAAAGWEGYFEHIEIDKVMKQVDFINLMTYDLAGGIPLTNHHTNLYGKSYDQMDQEVKTVLKDNDIEFQSRSADDITQYCINLGVDPGQIIIGGAFYGRSWAGVPPKDHGLHQSHNGLKGAFSFASIQQKMLEDPNYVRYWDELSKAPYIYNEVDSLFISYDDPESLGLKTRYVKEQNLGGIMFWQLSQDTKDNELVNAIYQEASKTD